MTDQDRGTRAFVEHLWLKLKGQPLPADTGTNSAFASLLVDCGAEAIKKARAEYGSLIPAPDLATGNELKGGPWAGDELKGGPLA